MSKQRDKEDAIFFCWQFVVKTMNCQQFNEQSLSSASPPPLPQKVMHRWKVVESPSPPSHKVCVTGQHNDADRVGINHQKQAPSFLY